MTGPLVECVPNFSEGRDRALVSSIAAAIASAEGVAVLDVESDGDHHRSVITFAGPPDQVLEGLSRGFAVAVEGIDLRVHSGVHPRIGAVDVVPFIPLRETTLDDCASLARKAAESAWERFGVPGYLYGAAALHEDRVRLEKVRKGQFEGLRDVVTTDPARRPDVGGPELHRSAGATAFGARRFLIAFNVNLQSNDLDAAKAIAKSVRESGGGLPYVKAMGVPLASRNLAQVTMNLTNFEHTPVAEAYEAVRQAAAQRGIGIEETELIGMIPEAALQRDAEWFRLCANFEERLVLDRRLGEAGLQ